jgi:hypothetical protein
VKERSQLHKIIDPHCWIFGAQFHLATSDKSFREVIRRHRKKAGLADIDEQALENIGGVDDIPDLFLASTRDFPLEPKHHHLLVELKAPRVGLGREEAQQIRRYAETILESHEFDTVSTRWDIFLVSSRCGKEIERDRNQKDKAPWRAVRMGEHDAMGAGMVGDYCECSLRNATGSRSFEAEVGGVNAIGLPERKLPRGAKQHQNENLRAASMKRLVTLYLSDSFLSDGILRVAFSTALRVWS